MQPPRWGRAEGVGREVLFYQKFSYSWERIAQKFGEALVKFIVWIKKFKIQIDLSL
jgi:hypothetical protein